MMTALPKGNEPQPLLISDKLLKRTTSRCPVCHAPCPAEVWRTGGLNPKVFLKRTCAEHGEKSVCIASDPRFYWLATGRSKGCGPGAACSAATGEATGTLGQNAEPGDALGIQEKLSTCLALIEIVDSCNLACPTCYADSPVGTGANVRAVPLDDLKRRIQGVIDRKGKLDILQLSGGEPTLHPQFFALLDWLQRNPRIQYVLLNTNGVRLAKDDAFAAELKRSFKYGRFQLYLQFDGPQMDGQLALRGTDLRSVKKECLERCASMNVPVTLAMTVTSENLPFLWQSIEYGLGWPNVRGISFQPLFGSGRLPDICGPEVKRPNSKFHDPEPPCRLNTADVILATVEQSGGQLCLDDFTPLPCGDPNCATIGYLLKVNGKFRSISDFIDFKAVQGFLSDKLSYRLEDLMRCGCESEPLGALLKRFELDESHAFRLFIKPFMDAWTWDEDRIDRCCTHVIRPDGKLDSFCRYYSGFA